ncbi:uncharacterized protein LOC126311189 [Schistocerca gregaria]|uniref:uncharacterized protein LOC126311189 n=1 Tax=Schistocerca gregaria TaxID=7010 RepID=UPI00211ED058|nr:uncharacterized protein LOC126311189 [Schistocerca gregaria]XP_049848095.1 uncharacterized protein LOC126311189 [Schistocerca gregaria]
MNSLESSGAGSFSEMSSASGEMSNGMLSRMSSMGSMGSSMDGVNERDGGYNKDEKEAVEWGHLWDTWMDTVESGRMLDEITKFRQATFACITAYVGNLELLQKLLECGVDIHCPDYDGRTALHLAVCSNRLDVLNFLIDSGAKLGAMDRWGNTAMDDALRLEHYAAATLVEVAITKQAMKMLSIEYMSGDYIPSSAEYMRECQNVMHMKHDTKFYDLTDTSVCKLPTINDGWEKNKSLIKLRGVSNPELAARAAALDKEPAVQSQSPKKKLPPTSGATPSSRKNGRRHSLKNGMIGYFFNRLNTFKTNLSHRSDEAALGAEFDSSESSHKSADALANPPKKPLFGIVFNEKRGACQVFHCNCKYYVDNPEAANTVCTCTHFPASHECLGMADELDLLHEQERATNKASALMSVNPDSEYPKVLNLNFENEDDTAQFSVFNENSVKVTSLDPLRLLFERQIGKGSTATIYRGSYDGQEIAIKLISRRLNCRASFQKLQQQALEEFRIVSSIRSDYILRFYGAVFHPRICLAFEYAPLGSLYDVMNGPLPNLSWALIFKWMKHIILGVKVMHEYNPPIYHRDLKTPNILVNANYDLKISDFGLARIIQDESTMTTLVKLRGTYAYTAPEVYQGERYTELSDMYSVGIIFWEIAYLILKGHYQRPYEEYQSIVFDFQIIVQVSKKNTRPTIPNTCPEPLKNLIERLWSPDPKNRLTSSRTLDAILDLERKYNSSPKTWDSLLTSKSSE